LCNGIRHGKGKLYVKEQLIYDGEWMNDMYHGKGREYLKAIKHSSIHDTIRPW
jgi:hypothetical protein